MVLKLSFSQESSNEKFQRLNDAYHRIIENLDESDNINYHKAQTQARNRQTHYNSRTQYQYDEDTNTWTDFLGNKFRFGKSKLNEDYLRLETW